MTLTLTQMTKSYIRPEEKKALATKLDVLNQEIVCLRLKAPCLRFSPEHLSYQTLLDTTRRLFKDRAQVFQKSLEDPAPIAAPPHLLTVVYAPSGDVQRPASPKQAAPVDTDTDGPPEGSPRGPSRCVAQAQAQGALVAPPRPSPQRAAPRPAVFDAPSPTIELGHELFDDTKTPFRRPARSRYVTYITQRGMDVAKTRWTTFPRGNASNGLAAESVRPPAH